MPKKHLGELKGDLFLIDEENRSFTVQQIQLLQAIEQCGSITKASLNWLPNRMLHNAAKGFVIEAFIPRAKSSKNWIFLSSL